MKMLMIICPPERQEAVRDLLARHGLGAYSEIAGLKGEGKTGKKLGTRLFPEESVLIFTVIPESRQEELVAALKDFASKLYQAEGMKVFALPVETLV